MIKNKNAAYMKRIRGFVDEVGVEFAHHAWVKIDVVNETWEYMRNSNVEESYCTGNLEIDGNVVTCFDGVYELPLEVARVLKSLGYELALDIENLDTAPCVRPIDLKECSLTLVNGETGQIDCKELTWSHLVRGVYKHSREEGKFVVDSKYEDVFPFDVKLASGIFPRVVGMALEFAGYDTANIVYNQILKKLSDLKREGIRGSLCVVYGSEMTNQGDYIWFSLLDWTFGYGPHTKGDSLFDEEGKVKDLPREIRCLLARFCILAE